MKWLVNKINIILINSSAFHIPLLVAFWLLSVGGRLYANGSSYGLNYSVFQPDGVLYALRTFMFLGEDQLQSAKLIEQWYFVQGGGSGAHFDPSSILPSISPAWGLVAPRILYPLLSAPFVAVFGMNGLLVIPSLSLLILVMAIYLIGRKYLHPNFSLLLCIFVMISPTVLRWMVANITDSLFVALFAITCLCLELDGGKRRTYFYLAILIILTSLTRFATPIWLAIALVDLIQKRRGRALFMSIGALVATIPTYLTQPSNSVLPREGDLDFTQKLLILPISFLKILFIEVAQLAVLDRLLLLILATSLVISLYRFKNASSLRFIFILLATWAIGALNGSIGVNFRYQLPVLPFACAVLIINAGSLRNWFFWRIGNVKVKETE
jgi:hypothetical protein